MTTLFSSPETIVLALSYALGVFASALPIHIIVDLSWKLVEVEAIQDEPYNALHIRSILRRYIWQGDLVGIVERALYVTVLLIGRPEFVAVWLTLKTVARSPRWTQERAIKGRGLFNNFLIGNGLSIFLSVAAVEVANLLAGPAWLRNRPAGWAIVVVLSLLTLVGWGWLSWRLNEKWSSLQGRVSIEAYVKIRNSKSSPRE